MIIETESGDIYQTNAEILPSVSSMAQIQQSQSSDALSTSARHVHFHMHVHPSTVDPVMLASCSALRQQPLVETPTSSGQHAVTGMAAGNCYQAFSNPPLQHAGQQQPAGVHDTTYSGLLSLAHPAEAWQLNEQTSKVAPSVHTHQQRGQQQLASVPLPANVKDPKPSKGKRLRSVMRALVVTGAATAAVLAGAATAVAILSPRVEQLESKCVQVCEQNKELQQQTSSLAAAKQQLEQQLQQLEVAKQQLDQQITDLSSQQGGLKAENAQLRQHLETLHSSQQQLQQAADQLQVEVADAAVKLEQQQQQQQQRQLQQQPQQLSSLGVAPADSTPKPGDLSVQVTVPGFTDALVSRISDAELVPQFAEALIIQVQQTGLVQHAVENLVGKVGQAVSSAVCPWKWNLTLPWQRGAQKPAEGVR